METSLAMKCFRLLHWSKHFLTLRSRFGIMQQRKAKQGSQKRILEQTNARARSSSMTTSPNMYTLKPTLQTQHQYGMCPDNSHITTCNAIYSLSTLIKAKWTTSFHRLFLCTCAAPPRQTANVVIHCCYIFTILLLRSAPLVTPSFTQ